MRNENVTYDQRHAGTLDQADQNQQPAQDLPPRLPLLFPARNHDHESDQGHAFHDHGEGHEEADRAPHGAEITIMVTVFGFGKALAFAGEGGATTVKTVGVVDFYAARLDVGSSVSEVPSWGGEITQGTWHGAKKAYDFAVPANPPWNNNAGQGQGSCLKLNVSACLIHSVDSWKLRYSPIRSYTYQRERPPGRRHKQSAVS